MEKPSRRARQVLPSVFRDEEDVFLSIVDNAHELRFGVIAGVQIDRPMVDLKCTDYGGPGSGWENSRW